MGIRDRPTSPRSPWQSGYAERLIGSIRRECIDHVIVFGECHLRHLLRSYLNYYNETRTHLVCTKNLIRIELVMKSRHAGGDDRLDFPGPQSAGCVFQVRELTCGGKCCAPSAADCAAAKGARSHTVRQRRSPFRPALSLVLVPIGNVIRLAKMPNWVILLPDVGCLQTAVVGVPRVFPIPGVTRSRELGSTPADHCSEVGP